MDRKELNSLIDRISLTGPEGTKKIKKVLKELSDGGGANESVELVIAQALNDLNERLEAVEERPIPKTTHVLTVLGTINSTNDVGSFLENLLLDGKVVTMDQLRALDINTVVEYNNDGVSRHYSISIIEENTNSGYWFINCTYYDYTGGIISGVQLGRNSETYYITTLD